VVVVVVPLGWLRCVKVALEIVLLFLRPAMLLIWLACRSGLVSIREGGKM